MIISHYYLKVVLTLLILKHNFIFQSERVMCWKKAPFFRVLPAFISGIFLEWEGWLPFWSFYLLFATGLVLIFSYRVSGYYRSYQLSWCSGAGIQILFLLMGALLCFWRDPVRHNHWYGKILQPNDTVLLRILETPVEKTNSFQTRAVLISAWQQGIQKSIEGKILVYFKKQRELPVEGSLLWINRSIDPIQNSGNPGEFDFKEYCQLQAITGSIYLEKKDILKQGYEPVSRLNKLLGRTQFFIRSRLKKWIPGKKESGLAEALLIGYRSDLDKDLSTAYANTGTVHIIAISGMHLALIYGLLMWLFKAFPEEGKIKWIRIVFLLIILWVFSLLCGAQPSILRATISFSFILLSQGLQRKSSTYNSLAGSAFLLLCWDPYNLWDPGFQLSFAAISSILIFNRPIRGWFKTENRILAFIYDLVAITLAAQILTFPISIYHFHQLPVYFLFSNLLAVPLSGIILIAEIILLFVSGIPLLAGLTGKFISFLIGIMNGWIEKIGQLPASSIKDIQINSGQLLMIYLFICFISLFLFSRNNKWLWPGYASLLLFFGIRSFHFYNALHQQRIIVYNLKGHSQVEYHGGRRAWSFFEDPVEFKSRLNRSRAFFRILEQKAIKGNAFMIHGRKILMTESFQITNQAMPDLLILHGRARLFINDSLQFHHPFTQIVLDGTVSLYTSKTIERFCDSLQINLHVVKKQGAFLKEL